MTPNDLKNVLQRAGSRRAPSTPIGDVTPNVLAEIRRRGAPSEDVRAWRWAASAAIAVAIIGAAVAAPSWNQFDHPLFDLTGVMPTVHE